MNTMAKSILLLTAVLALDAGAGQTDLPSAEKILDRYVEVTGGREAYDKIENRVTEGLIVLDDVKTTIPLEVYRAKPGKLYSRREVPQLGVVEKGATAEVSWEINPSAGSVVHEGRVRGAVLRQAVFDREVYWQKVWKTAECVGTKVVDGQTCYELVMTPKAFDDAELEEGNEPLPEKLYFSQETGLLVMSSQTFADPGSPAITTETHPSELHRVDGVLLPFRTVIQVEGQPPMVVEVHSLRQNLLLMPRQFALPDSIRTIVAQQREKG